MALHPSFGQLSRFQDGGVPRPLRLRLAAHLLRCAACRQTLQTIGAWTETARRFPVPPAPADTLRRLLERRAAGERVILTTADPTPVAGRWRSAGRIAVVTAAMLLSGVGVRATQGWGQLHLAPRRPARGAVVDVRYAEASRFTPAQRLALLGEVRLERMSFDDAVALTPLATLTRRADDTFSGRFTLPDSAVYVRFWISRDTTAVSATQPHWELLTYSGGRPDAAAILQRRIATVSRLPTLSR